MSSDISQRNPNEGPPDPPQASRGKKFLWAAGAIVFVLVIALIVHARIVSHRTPVAGGFAAFRAGGGGFGGALAVAVAPVGTGEVPITINSLGTVTPLATVTVHPQVTGPLVKINFTEGQMVKAGTLLAEIDPRPFQAALDQAQGQLQHDQALLANARVDLTRYKTLVAQNSVAEQTYATQQATVLQDEATLATDTAAIETAKLNLGYCRILAPVTGSVGLRQVDVGNMVSAYSSTIVVVTQLQPMSVLFTVPEDNLTEVLQRLHHGEKLAVDAYDRSFTTKLDTGVLTNTDNEIDPATGTLKLRALFNNAQSELFPSQFVNVRLTLNTLHDQLLVPGAAVQTGASGSYVYVLNSAPKPADDPADAPASPPGAAAAAPPGMVHVRYVVTGPTTGNMVSIRSGLKAGEIVVVDGADQLRDGASVTVPKANNTPAAGGLQRGQQTGTSGYPGNGQRRFPRRRPGNATGNAASGPPTP